MNSTLFNQILEPSGLERPSTEVAPDLLGCTLVRQLPDGQIIKQPGLAYLKVPTYLGAGTSATAQLFPNFREKEVDI